MDIDIISGLITCAVACLCWVLWFVGYIFDRIKHRRKVIEAQNRAIERVRRRDARMRRNKDTTFRECYLYGIGVDTSEFKNSDYVIFSLRIKEN